MSGEVIQCYTCISLPPSHHGALNRKRSCSCDAVSLPAAGQCNVAVPPSAGHRVSSDVLKLSGQTRQSVLRPDA